MLDFFKFNSYYATRWTVGVGLDNFLFLTNLFMKWKIIGNWKRSLFCSWHQKTNSPIHEFKVLNNIKPKSLLRLLFNGVLCSSYLFITLKNILSLVFLILKTFCSISKSWIGKIENSIFDVTNRIKIFSSYR